MRAKSVLVAFSLYSRIPMPHVSLNDDDSKYAITFLPLVGVVIGGIIYGVFILCAYAKLPAFATAVILTVIPLAVTGGFHADGFLDTKDALGSYQPLDKKLEILKDPHVGSAAVTSFAAGILIMAAGMCVIANENKGVLAMASVFVISRSLSALTSLCMKKAKPDGMLASTAGKKNAAMLVILFIQLIIGCAAAAVDGAVFLITLTVVYVLYTLYYRHMVTSSFCGVTGDTAGYYVVGSEIAATAAIAVCAVAIRIIGGI